MTRKCVALCFAALLTSSIACGSGGSSSGGGTNDGGTNDGGTNGGGTNGGGTNGGGAAKAIAISGKAATGAPLAGATVTLLDGNGAVVATTTTDANGAFVFSAVDTTLHPAPYVLSAFGRAGDTEETFVSVKPDAKDGTANITPITHAIAANLSSTGDPLRLVTDTATESSRISAAAVQSADAAYAQALANVMGAVGATGSLLTADLTPAHDKLLDNVSVDVMPSGQVSITSSGGTQADDLGNSAATPSAASVVTLARGQLPGASDAASLPPPAAPVAAADLEPRRLALENCFKIPSASRGTFAAPSAACANLLAANYLNDGRNGSAELDSSYLANSTFDGAKFLTPTIVRYLSNDRIIVSFPYTRADGVAGALETVADHASGTWVITGNRREFDTAVLGSVNRREILSKPTTNRYETGIVFRIFTKNTLNQVVVTGPGLPGYVDESTRGSGLTLKKKSGCDYLALVAPDGNTPYCVNYFRMRSRTFDGSDYAPSSANAFQYRSPYLGEGDINNLRPGTLYRFVITKTDATTVTYWNRLLSRPYTVGEMAQVRWIDLTAETRAQLASGFPKLAPAKVGVSWVVPNGIPHPFLIQIFHTQGNDRQEVPFTATSATVACSNNSLCASDLSGNYQVNSLDAPVSTIYQANSRNRRGTTMLAQFMQ